MTTLCTGVLQIAVRGAGGGDRFSPVGRRSEILMGEFITFYRMKET